MKTLENTDNLEALAVHIFGNGADQAKKREAFIESVQYYLSGTKEGFLKYKPRKGNLCACFVNEPRSFEKISFH